MVECSRVMQSQVDPWKSVVECSRVMYIQVEPW